MQVEMWPIERLKIYEKNPRVAPDNAVAMLAEGIKKLGFRNPMQVDKDGVLIAGHTRLMAAKKAGLKEVPVIVHADMSPAEAAALRIADNKLAELTDWSNDLLIAELTMLDDVGQGWEGLGFNDEELAALFANKTEGLTDPDEVPEPPVNPVTVLGDVWLLGKHRIVCGDSTKADDVAKALNGVEPHLMVTDPPYGVEYSAGWRNDAMPQKNDPSRQRDGAGRATGAVENDDKADWSEAWALFPGDVAYIWHAGNMAHVVAESLVSNGLHIRAQIIWNKHQLVIGRGDYHPKHEPCWYAVRKGKTGHYIGGRKQTTVWDIDKPQKSETGHSTQKPVECMKRPIENNSSPGQAVYEPFSGSGTTIIAGEMTGRSIHAIELSPAYVDVAIKRWQGFTGHQATLEGDGRTFAEVSDARYDGAKNSADSYNVAIDEMRKEHQAKAPRSKKTVAAE